MISPLLWQNESKTVTIIDVPGSIAFAQGTIECPSRDRLLSCERLQIPFASNEPKSASTRANVSGNAGDEMLHGEYSRILKAALGEVRKSYDAEYCHARQIKQIKGKRRASTVADHPRTTKRPGRRQRSGVPPRCPADGYVSLIDAELAPLDIVTEVLYSNTSAQRLSVNHAGREGIDSGEYLIPPGSSFYLGNCQSSAEFRAAIREQADTREARQKFDFILLDPPWPNRSVRRTHKTAGATYGIARDVITTSDLLLGLDLDMLMTGDTLVAIWITNKSALRDLVLGDGGLFDSWGVHLIEEWIWLKVTALGEPVTPIDAIWRKPYEVLLLGRRQKDHDAVQGSTNAPIRRVLLGVPDLHSRKPCVKALVEPLLIAERDYRCLEVFARHLVAGWWSWGNECIKFNAKDCWM
jgi:N6-adenosine-specific RNA methylase IME4